MPEIDAIGRATFAHIAPQEGVRPTARELRWLKFIERHGPQPSDLLHALTRDTHRCKDTSLRALQRLRAGGYLRLPPQQRHIAKADFKPYIYDLTKHAEDYLKGLGIAEATIHPTGHWWHALATAQFTGSLETAAGRHGIDYIPGHIILAKNDATLAIPLSRGRIIPDQLFALKYRNGYRVCLLEIDRGTEPMKSRAARRSLTRALADYEEMFAGNLHHQHYGHKATTLVLWVFENPGRMARFLTRAQKATHAAQAGMMAKCTRAPDPIGADFKAWHQTPWQSATGAKIRLI